MYVREVHIKHWAIMFIFDFDWSNWDFICNALEWADAPDRIFYQVQDNINDGRLDEGFTFSNADARKTVFAISKASSGPEVLDSTVHEIFHIVQHIAAEDDMDMFSESVAYLGGDISRTISDLVCELSCPHCNKHK